MNRINAADASVLTERLSRIMKGNLSPLNALEIVSEHMDGKLVRRTTERMISEMKRGETFAESAYISGAFDPCFLKCVEEAEENHRLTECLTRFADVYRREAKREQLLRGSVYFPFLVTFMAAVLLVLLLVFLYPGFVGLFSDTGIRMPGLTVFFLSVAEFFREYWELVALITIAVLVLFQLIHNSAFGRRVLSRLVLRSKLFYSVKRRLLYSRFAELLGALKSERVSDSQALSALAETFDRDIYFSERLYKAAEELRENDRLSGALRESGLFSEGFVDLLSLGEELGDAEGYLFTAAGDYLEEAERIAEKRLGTWEPLLIFLLIGLLLVIITSLALPTTALYESIEGLR